MKDLKWRPAPIKAKQDWQERFKNIRIRKKEVEDNLPDEPDNSAMAFALFDQNLYLENPREVSQSKVRNFTCINVWIYTSDRFLLDEANVEDEMNDMQRYFLLIDMHTHIQC